MAFLEEGAVVETSLVVMRTREFPDQSLGPVSGRLIGSYGYACMESFQDAEDECVVQSSIDPEGYFCIVMLSTVPGKGTLHTLLKVYEPSPFVGRAQFERSM